MSAHALRPYATRSLLLLVTLLVGLFALLLVERASSTGAPTVLPGFAPVAEKGNPKSPGNGNPKPCNNPGKADQHSRNCNPSKG